ncbi:MAG: Calx-beta domain-containing protein [Verrucomicrobiae bacterium]|nr:Calx-beta domain-containing protein [Verrucomicrobiae bacterium]
MKDYIKRFIGSGLQGLIKNSGQLRLAAAVSAGLLFAGVAGAQVNDNFASASGLSGLSGSTNGDNTTATLESCETNQVTTDDAGVQTVSNSVWYKWTAPASGTVEFDTLGSQINTVLAIWQVTNSAYTSVCDAGLTNLVADDDTGLNSFGDLFNTSYLTFPVVAGQVYFISVAANNNTGGGPLNLNWNMTSIRTVPSGTFRFATGVSNQGGLPNYIVSDRESLAVGDTSLSPSVSGARITVSRFGGASGRALVDYQVGSAYLTNLFVTNIFGTNTFVSIKDTNVPATTIVSNTFVTVVAFTNFYEYYNASLNPPYNYTNFSGGITNTVTIISNATLGVLISSNSVSGTFSPAPTNLPPVENLLLPPGVVIDASSNTITTVTNIFRLAAYSTNQVVLAYPTFGPLSGTLQFDDYQMSRTLDVPVGVSGGPDPVDFRGLPTTLQVTLSNPRLDPLESQDLLQPTLDVNTNALISVLSSTFPVLNSASVINFEHARLRVNEYVNNNGNTNAVVTLRRTGGLDQEVSVQYGIDLPVPLAGPGYYDPINTFPLQAGSDYATINSDFTQISGTATFAAFQTTTTISIPINNDGIVEFNEDMNLQIYNATPVLTLNPGGAPPWRGATVGEIDTATLTILFNDQPAGAADRTWNQNNVKNSDNPFNPTPGTSGGVSDSANGNGGTVYAVAPQPDGRTIIAGSFVSFDGHRYGRIARMLNNGFRDVSFADTDATANTGANDFIATMQLQPDGRVIIAGNFTSFNGTSRAHIARLNSDGTVDTTFNPGLGANDMIWSACLQPNGQIVIGGEFSKFNTNQVNGVARLNADGSVDTSFNPGAGPNGTVNAVAVDSTGRVILGGDFDTVEGVSSGGVARLNVDGSLDTSFNPGIGTYNPDTGSTDPIHAIALQPSGQILIGGAFTYLDLNKAAGIARLNVDGTVDTTFASGTGTYNHVTQFADTVFAITLQPDGGILIGGNFQEYNQTRRIGVARLFANGSLDTSFMDTAYNQFAGLINHYHNNNAVNTSDYPQGNQRNYVYAIGVEPSLNVIIGGGFLRVGGGATRDAILPRSNVARLIGGITPGPGDIQFYYNSYSVDKNGGSLYVSLLRENGNLGIISATFNTNTADPGPGIAIPDVNFTLGAASRTPTWGTAWSANAWMYDVGLVGPNFNTSPVNTTGANVNLNIINNTNITGNLSANLTLSAPNGTDIFTLGGENIPLGAAIGTQATAPLTIIDDNIRPGVLGFSSVVYSVVENQPTATITVVRTNGSDGVVGLTYKTANGTATNSVDYRGVTNTLSFAGGVTSQSFTIPIINGSTLKPDVTVKLSLSAVTGGATLGLTNATLTIINNNYAPGHLLFSAANYSTNENAGAAVVTVNRAGGSSGSLSVKVIANGGTAVNGVNYTALTNTLTWATGDVTSRNFIIPIFDDGVVTGNKTVGLRLTNSLVANVANASPLNFGGTNAVLTIVNVDSAGAFQFNSPVYSVKKYGGFALIPVVRTGGSAGTATVDFSTTDGTATAPGNYTATNGTLTFTNGEVGKFIRVPVIDDGTADGLLSLTLNLANVTGGATLGNPTNAVVNIIDTLTVNEPPGSGDVTYNATGFNDSVYTLALQSNNKLLVGGDFTLANGVPRQRIARLNADGTLDTKFSLPSSTYGANGSVRTIAVQADGRIMVGGFFTNFNSVVANRITRVNPDGTLDSLFNPGSGADNPIYALAETFVGGSSKMMVGGGFATLSGSPINGIARLNYDGSLDTAFNPGLGANGTVYALAMQPTDGKVVIGGDFTAVNGNTNCNHIARLNTDGSVDPTFRLTSGASHSVRAIAIQPDGNILIGGLFTNVNGQAASHIARLTSGGAVDATFTPGLGANDAVFSIALQSDNRIILGGEFTHCSGVTRNRITRLNPDGTVDPTINFGTGANNFVAAMVIQKDTIAGYPTNVPDEKIIIGGGFTEYNSVSHPYLARLYGGSVGGSGAFQFLSPTYSVDERGTNALITVIRTGGTSGTNAAGDSDVQVPFATSDDTAIAGINYTAIATNLVFPRGEVLQTITIPVMDDQVITPDLAVDLTLSPLIPSQVGLQPTAVLTIINDDSAISFSSATYTVPKNVINNVAVITVTRLGSVRGGATVNFTTTGSGTAAPSTDYTPVGPTTVTFADGASNSIVAIPINNNGLPEGNRTVDMQIYGPVNALLASPTNAELTIVDTVNAPGQLSFSATNYIATEGGGVGYTNSLISVVRTFGSAGVVSVKFLTADGTALAGTKYIATNGTLSFGDGETVKSFEVQVKNTTTAEGPEYLNLMLTNVAGGASLLNPTNATLTIINTNIGLAFVSATNTFSETGGVLYGGNPDTVFISVVRFNNTNGTTRVHYATVDGTATAGLDYTAISDNILTFNPGDSVLTVPVQLLHNTNVTGTVSFSMVLSNPDGGSQLTYPSTTVIQELDAEAGISFLSASNSVLKTAGFVLLPVLCSNPGIGPVSVNYATGGGTAAPGVDYTPTSGTLTFTNGQAVNYIPVIILPNGLVQSNQTFTVTLSSPVAPGVLVSPSVETVTIIETNTPAGSSFSSPVVLGGDSGSAAFDTSNSVAFTGSPYAWFTWTPTNSGEAEADTFGSVDDYIGQNLTTALVVLTGTNLNTVTEVAANEGAYPISQINDWSSHTFDLDTNNYTGAPIIRSTSISFNQPYSGPSAVRFNAVAGKTYTFWVLANQAGQVKLNVALHPSGVFRFATEEVDETGSFQYYNLFGFNLFAQSGLTYSNGASMLEYHVAETEADRRVNTPVADRPNTTIDGTMYLTNSKSTYVFDIPGMQVTVTRVAGSTGRVRVGYTTADIQPGSYLMRTNGLLVNGDMPASTNSTITTNQLGQIIQSAPADYTPVSGMLTFDDSEMSKTIFIPINDDSQLPRLNRDFLIILTNAVLDPFESTAVQAPRLDNLFSQAVVRILDADISPQGGTIKTVLTTNIVQDPFTLNTQTNTVTNTIYALQPTNTVVNFGKAHYRVTRDIAQYWAGVPITIFVNRSGTNNAASPTIHWRANSPYLDNVSGDLVDGQFPLQPGSDYATPTPPNNPGIRGLVPDFDFPGGSSGTISFPSGNNAFRSQEINFNILNNGLQQFNEDFTISLYELDKDNNPLPVGMIDQTTVTILFDDNHPPAGSVDEFYNADFSYNMAGAFPTTPPQMSHPGTDGEVLGLAMQPDDKMIVVGDFFSYDQTARSRIARVNTDGSLDTTFDPGSGLNKVAKCIVLNGNGGAFIGGAFSSYNGILCNRIALITPNGAVDPTFNAGVGFNGDVNAMAFQTNGELLVGGNFTSYNGVARHYLALIRADGTLDTAFDPGTNLNAQVLALGVQPSGQVIVGGDFARVGGVSGQDHIARLNADGSFDPSFDPGSGANASVSAVGIQPDGNIVAGGQFTVMNGATANRLARLTANGFTDPAFYNGTGVNGPVFNVLVATNQIYSTTNAALPVQTNFTIYVGGAFTAVNGTHRLGFTRLNADGTVDTTFLDTAYNEFAGLPRDRYNDPLGTVLTSGLQSDGQVMIGGSFQRVGGGQSDDVDVRPESIDTNNAAIINTQAMSPVQKTRAGIRNRSNVARLIGGATPGPGNLGLLLNNYSINKSQSPMNVSLLRDGGILGPATANFAVLPALAQSGVDYSYLALAPFYAVAWDVGNPMGRMHSDGLFGTNGFVRDIYGEYYSGSGQRSVVTVSVLANTNSLNNLTAQFQMANPYGADQFYLGGEDVPLGVALGKSVAPWTLIDDHHQSGTFGFTSANYVGSGQSATIPVIRTNGSYGVVYLSYATTTNGSTAILNNDYVASSGTLAFQPSDTYQSFNVTILNSNSVSAVEKTVNLTLFGLDPLDQRGLATLGLTNAVLHLINPNFQGFVNLSTNNYPVNLSAGSVTITVNRNVGSKGTVSVVLATTNGTAKSGTDYVGSTNTLQWNSGDTSPKTVTIPLINNGSNGITKQFGVVLKTPTLNGVSAPSLFATTGTTNAVVFIGNDNSYGSFQFSSPSYIANETGGYELLTVIRNRGTNGLMTVNYSTANGTALAGVNYIATNGILNFAPGQLAATIRVAITNDNMVDPQPSDFYFTVGLVETNNGASLGSPSTAKCYIVDASSLIRPPGSADTTFSPGAGMNADVFGLALQSSGQIIAGGSFTIVNGVPENHLARLNTDGSLDRSGFLYGLSGANNTVYAVVDQTDDQILIGGTFTSVNGTTLNHIARLNQDGTIDSSFNPGAGADNTVYAIAETFIGGSRKVYVGGAFGLIDGQTIPFVTRLNNDGTVDNSFATGSGPVGTVYAVAAYPSNSVFAGKVLIGGAFTNVNNATVGRIARLNADGSLDASFNLNVAVGAGDVVRTLAIQNDGSVVVGGDFTTFDGVALNHLARLNSDGTLDGSFTSNVGAGANGVVNALAIQTDDRIVVAGQFTQANGVTRNRLTRLLPSGAVDPSINFGDGADGAVNALVIQPGDQMIVIGGSFTHYNDAPAGHVARIYGGSVTGAGQFQFTSPTYSVDENGLQAIIGVERVGGTSGANTDGSGAVAVNFATSDGTAVAGTNYSSVNTTVTFPAGEVLRYVNVPVRDDSNATPNLTVNLTLSNPTPPPPAGPSLGDQSTALLTIINDDSGVSFGSASYSVPKNTSTGVGNVHVVRIGSASGTCSMSVFTATNGTAVPGIDYYPTNLLVTFNPGQTDQVVQVGIVNNLLPQGNRTVYLGMSNVVNAVQSAPSNTVLTIIDTVTAPGQLSFASTNFTTNANAGIATLTVVRSSGTSGSVSVDYATVPGTAVPNINYTAVSGTVTFNDGQTNATLAVPVLNNNLAIAPVYLTVVLSNPTGGATLTSPTNATLTIINTNVVIAFTVATNTFSETAGVVPVSVTRYNNASGISKVDYTTRDVTALSNVNYTATGGTLTFNPGEVSKIIPVLLLHDTNYTGTVAFNMALVNPALNVQTGTPNPMVIQITDAEAGISFTNSALTVAKNAGSLTVTVVCLNTNVEPVIIDSNTVPLSVNFLTRDGTGLAGTDYTAVNGTLVFTNGNGTNTFTVPILNNGLVNGDKTFSVILTNPTAPGVLVAPSTAVVTITDNNSGMSFSSAIYSVNKSAGAAKITVLRTDNTNVTSTVNFVATNGTLVFTNGATATYFYVPISSTTVLLADKTVLLQLLNPTNCTLQAPSAATLTLHDDSGSYVIPAGSLLTSETGAGAPNGIIDTNETVTLQFAFRDAGGTDVTNLVAKIITNANVTVASPLTNSYGPMAYHGHSVSRPFTFTAKGTNNQAIIVNFNLYESNTNNLLGTGVFGYTLGTVTSLYTNSAAIVINDPTNATPAAASPYPSIINVSGLNGTLVKATVTLNKLWHQSPSDIDALVQSPSSLSTLIMAHVGGQVLVTNVTLTFDDAFTNLLTHGTSAVTSTNRPSVVLPVNNFH